MITPKQHTHTLQYTHTHKYIHIDIKNVFTDAYYAHITNQHSTWTDVQIHTYALQLMDNITYKVNKQTFTHKHTH